MRNYIDYCFTDPVALDIMFGLQKDKNYDLTQKI